MKTRGGMRTGRLIKAFCIFICGYLVTYCLMMKRGLPAIDASREVAFKSSFVLAPVETTMVNGHTKTYVRVSLMNYFYAPLDCLYHKCDPAAYKKNEAESDFKPKDWCIMQ